jgi:2,4-dienoyl-CoA reductase (NADPH2)
VTISAGARVVIVGGSATGCEAAELAVAAGARVTILELGPAIGEGIEAITRRQLVRSLRAAGARLETGARVVAIDADAVRYAGADGGEQAVGADVVALAVGWRPRGAELAERLDGVEVLVVGDAVAPGDFVAAVNAGADAGLVV